ncbi:hypothetical protein Pint_14591 [Pistacia integerrima]|uniref:Uncharacterized protein n=1 Tax=Pistacia integerrima TaxID=434235 RepID=A0ACC0YAM8_9ROSI|nr:hypothetical protein Pint_14591 [Pistacia integerrima]
MGKMACFLLWESMLDFVAMNKVSQEGNLLVQCHLLFGSGGQQQTSSICCSFITQLSDNHGDGWWLVDFRIVTPLCDKQWWDGYVSCSSTTCGGGNSEGKVINSFAGLWDAYHRSMDS